MAEVGIEETKHEWSLGADAGEHEHREIGPEVFDIGTEAAAGFVGEIVLDQHAVNIAGGETVERLSGGFGEGDRVAELRKHARQDLASVGVAVDTENFAGGHGRSSARVTCWSKRGSQ